jgi:1,4-alpha-glucan branching enzyme
MLLAATILLTMPAVTMLFQGQEFMESGAFSDWKGLDWTKSMRYKGITTAFKHLVDLRKNKTGITGGLTGKNIDLSHVDQINKVIAYHRWNSGGPGDDVIAIINFSNKQFSDYELNLPRDGEWHIRFNSTWQGYSPDFNYKDIGVIKVQNNKAGLRLPASCAIILSQNL